MLQFSDKLQRSGTFAAPLFFFSFLYQSCDLLRFLCYQIFGKSAPIFYTVTRQVDRLRNAVIERDERGRAQVSHIGSVGFHLH